MAERLTEVGMFIDTPVFIIKNGKKSEAVDKLAQLEDILEKYGVESVEELDFRLAFKKSDVFNYKVITELEQERDTWKRACELACNYMCKFVIPCPDIHRKECESFCDLKKADCYKDYFYQQAKKDGNDERN